MKRFYSRNPELQIDWWNTEEDARAAAEYELAELADLQEQDEPVSEIEYLRIEWGELSPREVFTKLTPEIERSMGTVEEDGDGLTRWYSVTQRLGLFSWYSAHEARQAALDELRWMDSGGELESDIVEVHIWSAMMEQEDAEAEWGELVPRERVRRIRSVRERVDRIIREWREYSLVAVSPTHERLVLVPDPWMPKELSEIGFCPVSPIDHVVRGNERNAKMVKEKVR